MFLLLLLFFFFFFFNHPATTEIYTLSLHDALPISSPPCTRHSICRWTAYSRRISAPRRAIPSMRPRDRKSTRLNSSHTVISYAVFCLKKKKNKTQTQKPGKIRSKKCLRQHTQSVR